jgi:hypothetical protein
MLLAAVALVPVAPKQGSPCAFAVALFPPLLPPLLMRSGHKLRCTFAFALRKTKAQVANSRQRYFAGGCAPGISCVAKSQRKGSQQQAKVLCWRVRSGHKLLA